jgi:uncharacterized protein (TIGR03546 family)
MFWLKIIKDLIKIFREGQTPAQIAGGFALGMVIGLSPSFNLQGLIIWILLLSLNVNLAAALLAITFCNLLAYLFDPFFHWLGYQILTQVDFLKGLWTYLYNAPLAPLTNFNNTVVMGSFITALILFLPVYIGMKKLTVLYRKKLYSKIRKLKIYEALRNNDIIKWYMKIRDMQI